MAMIRFFHSENQEIVYFFHLINVKPCLLNLNFKISGDPFGRHWLNP